MSPVCHRLAAAEGTVLSKVTSVRAARCGKERAFSAKMTFPPQLKGAKSSKIERSKQSEVDAKTPLSSSLEKTLIAQERNATVFRCSIATPLGFPVEPEV